MKLQKRSWDFISCQQSCIHIHLWVCAGKLRFQFSLPLATRFQCCLMDHTNDCNVVHYSSVKCRRVVGIVLVADLCTFLLLFDHGFMFRVALKRILNGDIPIKMFTDSKCPIDVATSPIITPEKRLQLNLSMLWERFETRDISEILWIPGSQNSADFLTMNTIISTLRILMESNRLELNPEICTDRPSVPLFTPLIRQTRKRPIYIYFVIISQTQCCQVSVHNWLHTRFFTVLMWFLFFSCQIGFCFYLWINYFTLLL